MENLNPINDIFIIIAQALRNLMTSLGLAGGLIDAIMAFLRAAMLGTIGLLVFMLLTWLERKVVARIQDRIGPNLAGPWGLLQPIADGVKAITKEDTTPRGADVHVFNAAPIVAGVAAMLVYAVIPFGPDTGQGPLAGADLNLGLFYILAVGAVALIGVLMAGWSSNNKYALVGAFRAVAELLSYEVPQVLSVAVVVMISGSMQMTTIVNAQKIPFIFPLLVTALVFFISGLAESGRVPFDLVEAESEIVAGYHIEYSGMKFSLFFLGEFIHAFAVCAVFSTIFLQGWNGPILPPYIWFFIKSFGLFFVMMWIKFTLPRFRIDQLMAFNWKFLVPLSLVNLLVVAVVDTVLRLMGVTSSGNLVLVWGGVLFIVNLIMLFVALSLMGRAVRRNRLAERRIVVRMDESATPTAAPAN
jgi:NADH-quinone oxidoreductase subunit H